MELVVAVNKNGIIGAKNRMLWMIKEDLKHFRNLTYNEIIVMGRNTYESLPSGPLEGRVNIIITSDMEKYSELELNSNVIFCSIGDSREIMYKKQKETNKKIFIIGGSQIYKEFYKECKRYHITRVETDENAGVSIKEIIEDIEKNKKRVLLREKENKEVKIDYRFEEYE